MDYIIAIPSYKRSTICNNRTLTTLHHLGIPKHIIYIFIVQDQLSDYLSNCNHDFFHQLIIGVEGLIPQRQFISDFFPPNTHIISLDDDIESLDLSLTHFQNADQFFRFAFSECIRLHSFIWGIYPVFNPYFRSPRKFMTTNLSFIIGSLYGYINRHNDSLKLQLTINGNKDDVERSILYYLQDGIVLRFNTIGFKTKMYGSDGGGLGTFKNRLPIMMRDAIAIHQKYPHLTRIKVRKNGLYEIVFRNTR